MNHTRSVGMMAACALLSVMTACTERTKENMVPTGEVVEVEIQVPDTVSRPAPQILEVSDYSIPDLQ